MDKVPDSSPSQQESTSWWRATDAPPPVGIYSDRFSPVVSVLAALFLTVSLISVVWLSASIPKLDRMESPERALTRMVSGMLDAQEGLNRAPAWKQQTLTWISGDSETERMQAIVWYRELAQTSEDPIVPLQLAVLQAESGQVSQALLSAHEWDRLDEPFPRSAGLIRAAYGEGIAASQESLALKQAEAAELLPAGWFYDRLAERLARKANDVALLDAIQKPAAARADRIFNRSWRLTVAELLAMLAGTIVLIGMWRKGKIIPDVMRLHHIGVPPPWPGGVGAAVLLRGGALGAIVTAVWLLYMPPENASLRALAIPMTNLPLLALAYHYLFRPSGMSFDEGFGLDVPWNLLGRLLAAVVAVVAAGLWGEWAMDRLSAHWQWSSHWTEWFDADLVWGSPAQTLISLIEYVVFAPLFEELAFRGLLFAILRRKFRFLPAALISAGIFGVAHGYGLVGLVSVCWSGVLWAWIYEKTGSLLPGMIAHAINNLLVCLAVMALLRT
ncbi:MAG: CPBP family intramembrane metalloprotease [Nitrospira sp. CR1.3]|nr:CPBP family intramembrane metalloprotease [Nitrospira sp. CR1.3]